MNIFLNDKIFSPGLFRFFLASLVFLHHLSSIAIGVSAVLTFFFLSGFWISKMYEEKYSLKNRPLMSFYVGRILRVFPVFILINILIIILDYFLQLNYIDNAKLSWLPNYILFGFNYFNQGAAMLTPAWSLEIELIFYLIFPLFFMIKNKTSKFLIYFFIFLIFFYDYFITISIFNPFGYFIFFFLGNISYRYSIKVSKKASIVSLIFFIFVVFIMLFVQKDFNPMLGGSDPSFFFKRNNDFFNLFIAIILIPFALQTLTSKNNFKNDRFLGDMSYIVYLGHWITIICIFKFKIYQFIYTERIFYTFVLVIITYLISFIITRYFDYFFEKLRKKIISHM